MVIGLMGLMGRHDEKKQGVCMCVFMCVCVCACVMGVIDVIDLMGTRNVLW